VGDGDDYDAFTIKTVKYSVREARQQATANSWFDFRRGLGKTRHPPNSSVKLIEKLCAQAGSLFVVPDNCIIEFLLCS
jgi:hypothetical protein